MSAVLTGLTEPAADVVLGGVAGLGAEATTAAVAQPTPSPSPSPQSFSPLEVSPGLAGFIPVFLIALACIFLFLSLTRHLRRVTVRQAQVDAAEREQRLDDGGGASGLGGAPGLGGASGRGGAPGLGGPSGAAGPDDDGPVRR